MESNKKDELPLNDIFVKLANFWSERNDGASNTALASHLGIRPQSCSQWKTGTDGRKPTWSAIISLCEDLNMQVVIDGDGVEVKRRRKKKKEASE
jgi:hypothetical protein